ncbi:probable plastid-lipid-associated protein 9, chloroplastic [Hordeum vulgare subsp. vulgare]|uniref:probable plastid-lipid-associated protein 9, chloroplastic n=1 Tax=Hordeum vulgare subsp. vulgare TaxID=112509 RepID=UPI001D1A45DA|nr:probable plastid-lipid-associated protein 9, chloroplastic [Hordeum vulgare subsp. vulgare]
MADGGEEGNAVAPRGFWQRRGAVSSTPPSSARTTALVTPSYAREMERLSAKESLLLAFRDSGGFESFVGGKTTEMQKIDVDERIVGLERLNPTPRPTTSPYLEGRWNIEWFGHSSPESFASKLLFDMGKEYFEFLNKYLAMFDGSTDEADAIGAAKEEAAAAII